MSKHIAVVGLSGGMDSTTLLSYLLFNDYQVTACHFQYGSKHNQYERNAIDKIIDSYYVAGFKVDLLTIDLTNVGSLLKSDLLKSGGAIPEGHYEAESMKATVVPGRNLLFASIMAAVAESLGGGTVFLGVHSGDHHIYPDCRESFINSLKITISYSTDGTVDVRAPFIDMDKTSILEYGYGLPPNLEPPYEFTRTCYKDQELSCGKCGSCQERLEAFKNINRQDPVQYEQFEQ